MKALEQIDLKVAVLVCECWHRVSLLSIIVVLCQWT